MTIDLPNEYERLLNELVSKGVFASTDDAIKHAVHLLAAEQQGQMNESIPQLPATIDIDELATNEQVATFDASRPSPIDAWPKDEPTDDFLSFVRQTREDSPRSSASH